MKKIFCKYSILFLASTVPLFSMMSDQNQGGNKVVVASPAYDFTFKRLFNKSEHLINFLNSLFYPNAEENDLKIRKITYNSESAVSGQRYKHIYFDISCTCEAYALINTRSGRSHGEIFKFDVEMQRKSLECYYKRSIFYGAKLFTQDIAPATSFSDIPPVKVVSFLRESFSSPCDEILYRVTPTIIFKNSAGEEEYKEPAEPTMEWFYIQLDKIPEDYTLTSSFDQWINFMDLERYGKATPEERYAYTIDRDKFTDAGVQAAVDEMKKVVETDFEAYKKNVSEEINDSMLVAEEQKKLAEARAEAQAERAKVVQLEQEKVATMAKITELEQKLAELKRQSEEPSATFQSKKQKTQGDSSDTPRDIFAQEGQEQIISSSSNSDRSETISGLLSTSK